MKITFLGTGGGRIVTVNQERCTGGIYLQGERRVHIDPGPGAALLLRKEGKSPLNTDAILVSHCHPDHYSDAEVLLEGMYLKKREPSGLLLASKSVLEGVEDVGPAISKYHQRRVKRVVVAEPGRAVQLSPFTFIPFKTYHNDPSSVGFIIDTPSGRISYVSDTSLNPGLLSQQKKIDLLILSVTRPLEARIKYHLSTEDAAFLVEKIKPALAIMTHFGKKAINSDPDLQAGWVHRKTKIKTVAAKDGMVVEMSKGGVEVVREGWSEV
ncbi:MAG: MBL fold metallo-hydrolase [Thermoplasmata archaeon]|nr:MBL fold metallo-hydrolase [Thermoplasmata archaeon]